MWVGEALYAIDSGEGEGGDLKYISDIVIGKCSQFVCCVGSQINTQVHTSSNTFLRAVLLLHVYKP